jgi:hypothetical protein
MLTKDILFGMNILSISVRRRLAVGEARRWMVGARQQSVAEEREDTGVIVNTLLSSGGLSM